MTSGNVQLQQNVGQGFANLGSLFAPPSMQDIVAKTSLAEAQNAADQKAKALANIETRYDRGIGALYGSGDLEAIKHGLTFDLYQRSQADTPDIAKLDRGSYALRGNAGDTFMHLQSTPLVPGQQRFTPQALANALGVPQVQTAPPASVPPKFGVLGADQFGNKQYGYPPTFAAQPAR